jgi:hypothetical protein
VRRVDVVVVRDEEPFGVGRGERGAGVPLLAERAKPGRHRDQPPALAGLVLVLAGVVEDDQFPQVPRVVLAEERLDQLAEQVRPVERAAERGELHDSTNLRTASRSGAAIA